MVVVLSGDLYASYQHELSYATDATTHRMKYENPLKFDEWGAFSVWTLIVWKLYKVVLIILIYNPVNSHVRY